MTNMHFSGKRAVTSLACLSLVSLLTACGTPDGGYYDANGNYIATDTPHNRQQNTHSPLPGGTHYPPYYYNNRPYDRAGYYDYYGYYVGDDLYVAESMLPPRHMCRVWFLDRAPADQPPVESCTGVKSRVPAGAYVIFGG